MKHITYYFNHFVQFRSNVVFVLQVITCYLGWWVGGRVEWCCPLRCAGVRDTQSNCLVYTRQLRKLLNFLWQLLFGLSSSAARERKWAGLFEEEILDKKRNHKKQLLCVESPKNCRSVIARKGESRELVCQFWDPFIGNHSKHCRRVRVVRKRGRSVMGSWLRISPSG